MPVTITTSIDSTVLAGLEGAFDLSPLADFSLTYESAILGLGDAFDWNVTSIASTEIVLTSSLGQTATLAGSGIGPVNSVAELEAAIDGGFATGEFDSLIFTDFDGVTEILELSFDSSGITLISGAQELALEGAMPGSFDDIWALGEAFSLLGDPSALSQQEYDDIIADLSATTMTGLTLTDNGDEIMTMSLPDGSISLTVGEVTLDIQGSIGNDLGDLVETLAELMELSSIQPLVRVFDSNGTIVNTSGAGFNYYRNDAYDVVIDDWGDVLSGTYYVAVSGLNGTSGQYELLLDDGWDTYYETDEVGDASNTVSGAQQVDINTAIFGEIDGAGDVDFYAVDFTSYDWLAVWAVPPSFEDLLGQLSSVSVDSMTLSVGGETLATFSGDLLAALAEDNDDQAMTIDGMDFRDIQLDLDIDGTSGSNRVAADQRGYVLAFSGADTVFGSEFGDHLDGGGQGDTIYAGLGADTVVGGQGADIAYLGSGSDVFFDNTQGSTFGDDTVFGGAGNDTVYGGGGSESIEGGTGSDVLSGGKGADTIKGQGGADVINAGKWHDVVMGGDGTDLAYLGGGDDSYSDTSQGLSDTVWGGDGNDSIHGGAGGDDLRGQAGSDVLTGANGSDTLYGGDQGDTLDGGAGNDVVAGGKGMDTAYLGTGADTWFDDNQQDFGDDRVYAGGGWDNLFAVGGDDTMTGGAGADSFTFAETIGDMVITDYAVGEDDLAFAANLWNGALSQAHLDTLSDTSTGTLVLEFAGGGSVTFEGLTDTAGLLGDIVLV